MRKLKPHVRTVIFEGVDYSGKSTQAQSLLDVLDDTSYSVSIHRSPGGSPEAEEIRERARSATLTLPEQASLMLKAMHATLKYTQANYKDDHILIFDRWTPSLECYQFKRMFEEGHSFRDLSMAKHTLDTTLSKRIPNIKPFLFVLQLDAETFKKRKDLSRREDSKDRFDAMKESEQLQILHHYERIDKQGLAHYYHVIPLDASRSTEEIQQEIHHHLFH